jgi:hypothetical protein
MDNKTTCATAAKCEKGTHVQELYNTYRVPEFLSSRLNWVPPPPPPQACPPQDPNGGGGGGDTHSLTGEGMGESNSDDKQKPWQSIL